MRIATCILAAIVIAVSGCGGGGGGDSQQRAAATNLSPPPPPAPPAPPAIVQYDTIQSTFEVSSGANLMAQAEFNGDGLADLIAGSGPGELAPLLLLLSNGDGTLRNGTSEILLGDASLDNPNLERGATGDFNGDGGFTDESTERMGTSRPPRRQWTLFTVRFGKCGEAVTSQ